MCESGFRFCNLQWSNVICRSNEFRILSPLSIELPNIWMSILFFSLATQFFCKLKYFGHGFLSVFLSFSGLSGSSHAFDYISFCSNWNTFSHLFNLYKLFIYFLYFAMANSFDDAKYYYGYRYGRQWCLFNWYETYVLIHLHININQSVKRWTTRWKSSTIELCIVVHN